MSSRKRKNRPGKSSSPYILPNDAEPSLDPALFIQAHEADILRGSQAKKAAESLEVSNRTAGSGLIQWNPQNSHTSRAFPSDLDRDDGFAASVPQAAESSVWVDRYDARLLLDALPKFSPGSTSPAPSGWSDLPSDTEDMFFFSPDEAEDYRQEKRRRLMDQAREERLRARRAEDGDPEEEDVWGGSDEEPDEAQAALMKRTAASIVSTANPAQLEMRILANHGADRRFAFLRGRWKAAWLSMKHDAEQEEQTKQSTSGGGGLGNLADYGDSDEEDDEAEAEGKPEDALAARQARAKAWAELRRASKANTSE